MNRATFQFAGVINRGGSRKFPTCPWKFFSTEIKILLSLFSRNRQTERERERVDTKKFLPFLPAILFTDRGNFFASKLAERKTKVSDSGFQLVLCAHVENEPCFANSFSSLCENRREKKREREGWIYSETARLSY